MSKGNNFGHSPQVWGAVTANTDFTFGGKVYTARAMIASAAGTITVIAADGTSGVSKTLVAGLNIFQCLQVSNLGGLTLEWQA